MVMTELRDTITMEDYVTIIIYNSSEIQTKKFAPAGILF